MALKEKLIDKAQKLVQKGYYDKAVAEYRAAADADPRDISIRLRIGDLFVKLGRKDEAVKEYTEVAKANAQRGFYLKAIAVYKQVLKLDDSLEVHNKLAELYTKQRLIADAISEYSYIVAYFERRGKSAEVLDLLKKMVEVDPDNIGVRLKLAEIYQRMSFDKDAMAEYSLIFDKLVSQGKLERAEKMYLGLYNNNPADEKVMAGLAELYRLKGDTPQRVRFLKALLKSYNASARTDEARKAAETINEISPNDPDAAVFLKRSDEDGWDGQGAKGVPSQAGTPDEASSEAGELISWPEEEIAVPIEGLEEAKAQETPAEPEFEADAEIEAGPVAVEEPPGEESTPAVTGSYDARPPVTGTEIGHDEVEIDIEDLLNGELPAGAGAAPAPSEAGSSVGPVAETPEEAGPEVEIEAELSGLDEAVALPHEAAPEPQETLATGASVEEAGFEEEEIEIEVMPDAGIEEAATEGAGAASELVADGAAIDEGQGEALPEPPREIVSETVLEEEALGESAPVEEPETVGAEYIDPASGAPEPEPVVEATEPEGIDAGPGEDELLPAEEETRAAAPSIPEEPAWADTEESQEDISSAIKELMEKIEPEAQAGAAPARKEDYVDLTAELGMEEALTDLAGSWGSEEQKETFDEFRSGIGNQLNKEDSETHYNLGIAYMEMELFFEASKEFKIALKDPRLEFDCYTRLGLCAMALGEPQEAVTYYLKGIKVEGRSIEERIGMMYELGLAYEAAGETEEAEELFKGIHELAPSFREVADKVKISMQPCQFMPLDDGLLEVELL